MADNSKKDRGFSLLAGFGDSSRLLVVCLALIVLTIALGRGFLFFQFRNEVSNALADLEQSSLRNSYILTTYQLSLESYNLAGQFASRPAASILRQSYAQKVDSLRTAKTVYLALIQRASDEPAEFRASVSLYFQRMDTLLSKTDDLFDAKVSASGKLAMPANAAGLFRPGINNYFQRLRQDWQEVSRLELALNARKFTREKELIGILTERWFLISSILFVIAIGLTVILIVLAGRATSLARQLGAVLEHNVNPIEVSNHAGTILYVNSEFERWSGWKKADLVGTQCFDGVHLRQNGEQRGTLWNAVHTSAERGETWTGEVENDKRSGTRSSLIAIPVFDRKGTLRQIIGLHQDLSEKTRLEKKVEETREQYQKLIDSSRDAIVVVQDDRLVFVNPAAVRIFQYESEEEMQGLVFMDTVAPPSRPFLRFGSLERLPGEDILKNYEMKGLTKLGKLIDLEVDIRVILWNDQRALHASFKDITSRKALERQQAVWLWEQETLSSIDRQLLGIVDLHKVLDIILQHVMLLTRSEFVGVAMVDVENRQGQWKAAKGNRSSFVGNVIAVTPDVMAPLSGGNHLVLDDCRSGNHFSISDLTALRAEQIISVGFFPLLINTEPRGILVVGFRHPHRFAEREIRILVSMAEKVSIALSSGELYENLLKREKELELLSGARVQAQEEERRRISREIHDGLGQLLTAIKLNLEILEDSLPAHDEARSRVGESKQLLDNVLKEAREISYNLMPSVLDDFGLGPGLQSLCEQFSKRASLKISFHEHGLKERLTPDVEIGLYRIVQEALNNVVKHAEAKEVEVQIVRHKNRLRVTIEDDGIGISGGLPTQKDVESGGTGLVSMRERASSFGGTFLIDSSPGKGTMINVEIPMKEA